MWVTGNRTHQRWDIHEQYYLEAQTNSIVQTRLYLHTIRLLVVQYFAVTDKNHAIYKDFWSWDEILELGYLHLVPLQPETADNKMWELFY